ncbi:DinB family protein [Deinococcus frigens]|uniref:DinB family protein n=1 Tax=Deinococcus frigens TaxID=249403 RepID=UPI000495A699|nr:DinB family protein [Deinococcus frigens]
MTGLAEVVAEALPRLRALPEGQTARKLVPDVWSAKQILGHLIDSGVNNHARFVRASAEAGLSLPGYDQNTWVALGGYQERSWTEMVALWEAYQLQVAHVIAHSPPASLAHTLNIGGGASVTLEFVAQDYVAHQLHHLAQVWERTEA